MVIFVASCGGASDTNEGLSERENPDFASYAQSVYAELAREPLDSTLQTEVGLFGDMSVGEGENIVMGEYRFRLDSTEYGPVAHMAFQVRDAGGEYEPVPVVLQFVSRDEKWRLEEVAHHDLALSRGSAAFRESEPSDADDGANPLVRSVEAGLDPWVVSAVGRAGQ